MRKKNVQFVLVVVFLVLAILLLSGAKFPLSIVGNSSAFVGVPQSYHVAIDSNTLPISDYTSGQQIALAGQTRIIDVSGNTLFTSPLQELDSVHYVYDFSYIPTSTTKYSVVGVILASKRTYSNGLWSNWGNQYQVGYEQFAVNSVIPSPSNSNPSWDFGTAFANIINGIIAWLQGLFK